MWLACSGRCGSSLFRALFAEVDIDPGGAYLDHRISQAGYVCLGCGAPAVDLGRVPAAMAEEREADETEPLRQVLCPVCETLVETRAGEECPSCGATLDVPSDG